MGELPIWDDLHVFVRAGIQTVLFFFAPATVATGFSDDMVIRFVQTLGLTGVLFLGLTLGYDLQHAENDRGDSE